MVAGAEKAILEPRADKGPGKCQGWAVPWGLWDPMEATRMGGYASVQGEVREGKTAPPAGTGPPLGAAEPV